MYNSLGTKCYLLDVLIVLAEGISNNNEGQMSHFQRENES